MQVNKRTDSYIDEILKWENLPVILNKLHRKQLHPADKQLKSQIDPDSGERYFTYSWAIGNAPKNIQVDIELDRLEQSASFPCREPRLHNHDFFEIVYIYSGSCICTTGGRKAVLNAGDICLYNLQTIHTLHKTSASDVAFNIVINQDFFQRSFRELIAENDLLTGFFLESIYNIHSTARQMTLHPAPAFHCEELIREMIQVYYRDEPMCQSRVKALLILLLAEITSQYRAQLNTAATEPEESERFLSEIVSYIRKNYNSISLEQLSGHFSYTPRSMSRFLNHHGGTSYKEIVQQIRFLEACTLLTGTDMSISDIAQQIGYNERSSFDRAFKERYHVTAAEYRSRK